MTKLYVFQRKGFNGEDTAISTLAQYTGDHCGIRVIVDNSIDLPAVTALYIKNSRNQIEATGIEAVTKLLADILTGNV